MLPSLFGTPSVLEKMIYNLDTSGRHQDRESGNGVPVQEEPVSGDGNHGHRSEARNGMKQK
jgi:hypothetical protein